MIRLSAVAMATMEVTHPWPSDQAAPDPLPHGAIERIQANPNIHPAGRLSGRLTLALEARNGRWYPMADGGPSVETMAFAEGSGPSHPRTSDPVTSGPGPGAFEIA
jgi:hypothetical protein